MSVCVYEREKKRGGGGGGCSFVSLHNHINNGIVKNMSRDIFLYVCDIE